MRLALLLLAALCENACALNAAALRRPALLQRPSPWPRCAPAVCESEMEYRKRMAQSVNAAKRQVEIAEEEEEEGEGEEEVLEAVAPKPPSVSQLFDNLFKAKPAPAPAPPPPPPVVEEPQPEPELPAATSEVPVVPGSYAERMQKLKQKKLAEKAALAELESAAAMQPSSAEESETPRGDPASASAEGVAPAKAPLRAPAWLPVPPVRAPASRSSKSATPAKTPVPPSPASSGSKSVTPAKAFEEAFAPIFIPPSRPDLKEKYQKRSTPPAPPPSDPPPTSKGVTPAQVFERTFAPIFIPPSRPDLKEKYQKDSAPTPPPPPPKAKPFSFTFGKAKAPEKPAKPVKSTIRNSKPSPFFSFGKAKAPEKPVKPVKTPSRKGRLF